MTIRVAHLLRHPIKAHGCETVDRVHLTKGQTMPWDRTWAIAHDGARIGDDGAWASCANFSRGAKAPQLMAIKTKLDETSKRITFTHPDRDTASFHPEHDQAALLDWLHPLMPADRAQSARVVKAATNGMTDSDFASISVANIASNQVLEDDLGQPLDLHRWRANIWLDGMDAWSEVAWLNRNIRIGTAELHIREQITRCKATMANPDTGARDADTLGALKRLGHQEFGLYGVVTKSGDAAVDDDVVLI